MELSPAQRKLAFALIVFVLAGLGVYLFTSAGRASGHQHSAASSTQPAQSVGPPATSPAVSSSPPPPVAPSPTPTLTPDIYQWLPFTKAGLSSAAAVVAKFGAAYGTFSYTESTKAYVATMQNLATSQLAQQVGAAYSLPGVASMRTSRKQVSTGTATIMSLRAFGPSSLTFIVTVTEQITASKGGGPKTYSFAITVTGDGTTWQVSDIELASAGNT